MYEFYRRVSSRELLWYQVTAHHSHNSDSEDFELRGMLVVKEELKALAETRGESAGNVGSKC